MSGGGRGAASGAILGLVAVFLLQQLSYVDLTDPTTGLWLIIVPTVIGGVLFGIAGHFLGRVTPPGAPG